MTIKTETPRPTACNADGAVTVAKWGSPLVCPGQPREVVGDEHVGDRQRSKAAGFLLRRGPTALSHTDHPTTSADIDRLVHDWVNQFRIFLESSSPSDVIAEPRAVSRALEGADLNNPEVRRKLDPLAESLKGHLKRLLVPPADDVTADTLAQMRVKFDVLNYPSIRGLLPEQMQNRIGVTDWSYKNNLNGLSDRSQDLAETIKNIGNAMTSPSGEVGREPAPAVGRGPLVDLHIQSGDILNADADAVVTTVRERHLCGGGFARIVRDVNPVFLGGLTAGPELEDGQAMIVPGDGVGPVSRVIFVKDRSVKPLNEVIFAALIAADKAGLKSVALPAIRAGFTFGSVERSYDQTVCEFRKGLERFLAEDRTSLSTVKVVIRNNDMLAQKFQEVLAERVERERSVRRTSRDVRLSTEAFELTPNPTVPSDTNAPVYKSLLAPWSLEHLKTAHKPVIIGEVLDREAFSAQATCVLNMPVKLPGGDVRLPIELKQFSEFLQAVINHESAVNPDYGSYFMYLTVDQRGVTKGLTHRRSGVHIDGVQGVRYTVKLPPEHIYSVSDQLGTVFYDQPFNLDGFDLARYNLHAELERQADEKNALRVPNYQIAFWSSYSVHRADIAPEDLRRTFVRVEFSKKVYDGAGDTDNPTLAYRWERVPRPIPAHLVDLLK